MEYTNTQICDECLNNKTFYKFDCQSCGLISMSCKHNVFKCVECERFFCGRCSNKYEKDSHNTIICKSCEDSHNTIIC